MFRQIKVSRYVCSMLKQEKSLWCSLLSSSHWTPTLRTPIGDVITVVVMIVGCTSIALVKISTWPTTIFTIRPKTCKKQFQKWNSSATLSTHIVQCLLYFFFPRALVTFASDSSRSCLPLLLASNAVYTEDGSHSHSSAGFLHKSCDPLTMVRHGLVIIVCIGTHVDNSKQHMHIWYGMYEWQA